VGIAHPTTGFSFMTELFLDKPLWITGGITHPLGAYSESLINFILLRKVAKF